MYLLLIDFDGKFRYLYHTNSCMGIGFLILIVAEILDHILLPLLCLFLGFGVHE